MDLSENENYNMSLGNDSPTSERNNNLSNFLDILNNRTGGSQLIMSDELSESSESDEFQAGGRNDVYESKYMKYKAKYMKLLDDRGENPYTENECAQNIRNIFKLDSKKN